MSLLSALFICSTDGNCKNALLNAGLNDPEALFLYRIWDEIPDQKSLFLKLPLNFNEQGGQIRN
jgi:hypothetical protein